MVAAAHDERGPCRFGTKSLVVNILSPQKAELMALVRLSTDIGMIPHRRHMSRGGVVLMSLVCNCKSRIEKSGDEERFCEADGVSLWLI